jgi:hypothetical protein
VLENFEMRTIAIVALAALALAAPPAFAQMAAAPNAMSAKPGAMSAKPGAMAAKPGTMAAKPAMVVVNGTIAAVSGDEVDVTTADGSKSPVMMTDKTRIALSMPIAIDQIKPGSYVGAGAQADGKGGNTAMEITVFPESARGLGEGFRKWDQGPNSTMTNGTVSEVVGTSNRTITVTYKGGKQSVTIPDGTPITTFSNGDKTALVAGAKVNVRATKAADGKLTAGYISVEQGAK